MRVVDCLVYQVSWRVFFFGSVSIELELVFFCLLHVCVCMELIDRLCGQ
jgi:hypothetical protein